LGSFPSEASAIFAGPVTAFADFAISKAAIFAGGR
jgi:hypothetical protein